jgi:hypothetical protein
MTTVVASKWLRVNRDNPCPICGKPDWCLISHDGKAAICARIESDRQAGHKGAGWIHKLDNARPLPRSQTRQDVKQNPKAAPVILDKTYRALLSELPLFAAHRENLQYRGLTNAQITRLSYRTLPTNRRRELVIRLQANGFRFTGVPGFYLENGEWHLAGPAGIVIPVRDTMGRIVGLQLRCDKAEEGGRYKWISSRGFNKGCSPGAPVHVSGQTFIGSDIWITEGPLKADIAALKLERVVLGIAGVNNWPGVIPIIRELRPERVIVAFDMDKLLNPSVRTHSETLITCLIKRGIPTFEADWDSHFKGLDDLLTGEQPCQR